MILIWIGFTSYKKQSEEDFLIAERNLGAWRTMFTVNAGQIGSILMTFVAVSLWKEDMLAPIDISKQIEKERSHDKPYYLTSKVISTGTLFT